MAANPLSRLLFEPAPVYLADFFAKGETLQVIDHRILRPRQLLIIRGRDLEVKTVG
jgi:hypothetical protein